MPDDTLTTQPETPAAFEERQMPDIRFGIARPGQVAALTGLQQLQNLIAGDLPAPPMARTMCQWISELDDGMAEFRGEPGEAYLNPMGLVHGGWTMSLLDSALGCSVHTVLAPGETYSSLGTEVKFIRPILSTTGQVRATAHVVTRGRRTVTASGQVQDRRGRILATGTSTCFIQNPGKN